MTAVSQRADSRLTLTQGLILTFTDWNHANTKASTIIIIGGVRQTEYLDEGSTADSQLTLIHQF